MVSSLFVPQVIIEIEVVIESFSVFLFFAGSLLVGMLFFTRSKLIFVIVVLAAVSVVTVLVWHLFVVVIPVVHVV